jgi:hypothetical protein
MSRTKAGKFSLGFLDINKDFDCGGGVVGKSSGSGSVVGK